MPGPKIIYADQDFGDNNIDNVNLINNINILSHASRHLPNGADPLLTDIPISINSSNLEGVANSFSRSDHQHTIAANVINNLMISAHTSSKISITAKTQLNSNIVYTDQSNTYGAFDQLFKSGTLKIINPSDTFSTSISNSITQADRNIMLPDISGVLMVRDGVLKTNITTNDTNSTAVISIATTVNTGYLIDVRVIAKKSGGTGTGVIGDTDVYVKNIKVKNINNVLVLGRIQSTFTDKDFQEHNITITSTGTNVIISVIGSINNSIDWNIVCEIQSL
jgi:hypothetical protein